MYIYIMKLQVHVCCAFLLLTEEVILLSFSCTLSLSFVTAVLSPCPTHVDIHVCAHFTEIGGVAQAPKVPGIVITAHTGCICT